MRRFWPFQNINRWVWASVLGGLLLAGTGTWVLIISRRNTGSIYKEDYAQACLLIASKYVYLESKLDIPPAQFLEERLKRAEQLRWGKDAAVFRREMMALRALFPDGHFDVSWSEPSASADDAQFLGFVLTAGKSGHLRVARVYPSLKDKLAVGDEILTWDGRPIEEALSEIERGLPCSTPAATREVAARNLTLDVPWMPLRHAYPPVAITFRRPSSETVRNLEIPWVKMRMEFDVLKQDERSAVTCMLNAFPSIESIPPDAVAITRTLLYYQRDLLGQRFFIVHPRSFSHKDLPKLDDLLGLLHQQRPDYLVIDLHDSAGGSSAQCAGLLAALNALDSDFDREDSNSMRTPFAHPWRGRVLVRTNSITGSGGDLFARQMQLTGRAVLLGTPTAGRGGGYDTFTLGHTKTQLTFPIEDPRIGRDQQSLEGYSVIPDALCDVFDGSLEDQLAGWLRKHPNQ